MTTINPFRELVETCYLSQEQAAEQLGLSIFQFKRLYYSVPKTVPKTVRYALSRKGYSTECIEQWTKEYEEFKEIKTMADELVDLFFKDDQAAFDRLRKRAFAKKFKSGKGKKNGQEV